MRGQVETNHDFGWEPCLQQLLTSLPHVFSCVVGSFGTSTKDDMHIRIALGMFLERGGNLKALGTNLSLDNTAQTFLANGQEDMSGPGCAASIDGDANAAVRRIFETGGHREGGGKLAMDLRLGCTSANRTPCYKICGVLGADRIEEFASRRKAHLRHIEQKRTSDAESAVDLKGAVHIRVIDEPFPSHGRAGLLEVDAHDDVEVIFCGFSIRPQFLCVLNRGVDIMDGARADEKF